MNSAENGLYQIWNKEGEPNLEALSMLHEFHTRLKDEPRFIGVVPFGSSFKGLEKAYNTKESDIDIIILFSSDKKFNHPIDAPGSVMHEIRSGNFEFIEKVSHIRDALQEEFRKTINILTQIADPFTYQNEEGVEKANYFALARIAQCVTQGELPSQLRQKVKDFLLTQTTEKKEVIFDQVLSVLIDEDRKSLPKMLQRDVFSNQTEAEEWIENRKQLWELRIKEIFT